MKRNLKRGSAMIVVSFTVTAVAVTVVAGLTLTGSVSKDASKKEKKKEADYIADGAMTLALSDVKNGKLAPGQSKTYLVGGESVTVSATDDSGGTGQSVLLDVAGNIDGAKLAKKASKPLGKGAIDVLWSYGMYSNNTLSWPLGAKVTGSVFVRRNLSILGTGTITKDFKTSSSLNLLGLLNVLGSLITGVTAKTWPSVTTSGYTSNADSVLAGPVTLTSYTFPKKNALVVVNGDLTMKGNVNGSGTFYVTGNVTVNGNLTLPAGGDHMVVITPGNITFTNGLSSITAEGYYYAGGTMAISSPLTLSGAAVANDFSGSGKFTVTWDQWLTKDPKNGVEMKAPGMWP